ncbi:MAG: UTP--glucose-1-phosphate uridylyltransferase [Candidatus Margulisbacteria bacterium]|nr:UTP--glucose-1-phosphate uridylyltransferase [Candidatus Margulisiibacteriota bacterium]
MSFEKIPQRILSRVGRLDTFISGKKGSFGRLAGSYSPEEFCLIAQNIRNQKLSPKNNRISNHRIGPTTAEDFPEIQQRYFPGLFDRGKQILKEGQVGAIIAAGGVGARLGQNKIFWEIAPGLTLLHLKIWATVGRIKEKAGIDVPLFFMTSEATHNEVVRIAAETGLVENKDFIAANQSSLPILTLDGELVDLGGETLYSPTGHGDIFPTLQQAKALDWMAKRGVRYLVQSNVDNPLVVLDLSPENTFLAYLASHADGETEITAQVVRKEKNFRGGVPLLYKPADGTRRISLIESTQVESAYLDQFNALLPFFNPLTLIYNLPFLRDFDPGKLPRVLIERNDEDPVTKEVLLKYLKIETISGNITMTEPTTFLPDTIQGISQEGMFTQLKGVDQVSAWKQRLVSRFPDFFQR